MGPDRSQRGDRKMPLPGIKPQLFSEGEVVPASVVAEQHV
jgi:hypothetical protein